MLDVRPFEQRDLPEVAALSPRFQEIFLGNPWVDASLPSWVAREGSRIVGLVGVMPRPMRHRGKPVRAAVLSHYGLAAEELLRAALAGPQELAFSDNADDGARRIWEAAGGWTLALHGLQWRRLLSPVRGALGMLTGLAGRATAMVAAPIVAAADACMTRRHGLGSKSALLEQPLTATSLFNALETFGPGYTLRPRHDVPGLEWLIAKARANRRDGELQAQLLRHGGRIAGWFLYYLNGSTSKVLQLAARPGSEEAVLAHLFQHAWRRGAAAIEGRMEPRFARALSQQRCAFLIPGLSVVAHSRNSELLGALGAGEAFFSRLEGESWIRSLNEAPAQRSEAAQWKLPWARPRPQPAAT